MRLRMHTSLLDFVTVSARQFYPQWSTTYLTLDLETRNVVVSVGYRLAPEHPYPAAVGDCLGALQWVWKHCEAEWNVGPDTIKLVGLSAYVLTTYCRRFR